MLTSHSQLSLTALLAAENHLSQEANPRDIKMKTDNVLLCTEDLGLLKGMRMLKNTQCVIIISSALKAAVTEVTEKKRFNKKLLPCPTLPEIPAPQENPEKREPQWNRGASV